MAGDARRSGGPAGAGAVAGGQRRAPAAGHHRDHGVRRGHAGQLCQPLHDTAARGPDRDRHAAGRGHGLQAAALPQSRRHHAPRRGRAGRADAAGSGVRRALTAPPQGFRIDTLLYKALDLLTKRTIRATVLAQNAARLHGFTGNPGSGVSLAFSA
ncbi:protein of unknown function [Cupriavidus taiwanensis]|uniref:Uncharacterized protein n=1 Tax=Cupriavidus taiwanensis TaxID=164546 RepID=A0A375GSL9_9BURK|nr:hypothetical protein CBM2588_A10156 [Cupriavidus taiwanensis]SOY42442.1 hypothetical protein CBM2592_A10158 [Cupriavidus taiwanensis]SOY79037.1 hypothetical protein CBM2591_A10157 [Cupriavidus taiwanensis]SPA08304.1 hypothetical protein CBM2631_A10158 [Cupriavidus taiwanensis]SPA45170.1 hypothetical protein CBM2629_A20064 [Cupriavidus taiwanensis]